MSGGLRAYVTGADGMLGTALTAALTEAGWAVRGVSMRDFDIADAAAADRSIDAWAPDVVIHAAAHAIVDDCEQDPAMAVRVNIEGTRNIVAAARRHGCRVVYLSSDYVFDGRTTPNGGYREDDIPSPLNVYGTTKLAGEQLTATVDRHAIIRTSWLFGGRDERTDNVLALIRRSHAGHPTALIADQFSCPTYTVDLADAIVYLLCAEPEFTGIVHIANTGTASWHDVGLAVRLIWADLRPGAVNPPTPVPRTVDDGGFVGDRPHDSSLNTDRLAGLGYAMPTWRDAVRRFCERLTAADRSTASSVH